MGSHIRRGDGLVGVLLDILDAFVNIRGGIAGKLGLGHTARKIQHHIILHLIKGFCTLELFAFLDIDITELVSGFDVKTTLDRAAGCQCDRYDQNIFFSPSTFPLRI